MIGKLDPETGEIIPTGKRGRKTKEGSSPAAGVPEELPQLYEASQNRIKELTLMNDQKDQKIAELCKEIKQLRDAFDRIDRYLAQCREICAGQADRS